jgi:hypothetical protein
LRLLAILNGGCRSIRFTAVTSEDAMRLTSTAKTPAEMRDDIANYLANMAKNFAIHKDPTTDKITHLETIRDTISAIAEMVKSIEVVDDHPKSASYEDMSTSVKNMIARKKWESCWADDD